MVIYWKTDLRGNVGSLLFTGLILYDLYWEMMLNRIMKYLILLGIDKVVIEVWVR